MTHSFRLAVCENPPELVAGEAAWTPLCHRVNKISPDLLLMNELPFGPWAAAQPEYSEPVWNRSMSLHDAGLQSLGELGAKAVAITRPYLEAGRRVNQAGLWTREEGFAGVHTKQFFPEEEGYYEARWFEGGERHFRNATVGGVRYGFLICTELMFNEHARNYGRQGAQIILIPRATGSTTLERWLVALRMAAIVSGCYVATSNRVGRDSRGQSFGGGGWIVDPNGDVVAKTSPESPVVSHDCDLEFVARAQKDYPCYVRE